MYKKYVVHMQIDTMLFYIFQKHKMGSPNFSEIEKYAPYKNSSLGKLGKKNKNDHKI